MVLWSLDSDTGNRVSVPSSASAFVASILLGIELVQEHRQTSRPSTPALLFLTMSLLADCVQARTLWLAETADPIASVTSASVGVQFILITTEANVAWLFSTSSYEASPEQQSGIYSRMAFFWLVPVFWRSYWRPLRSRDLWAIDPALEFSSGGRRLLSQLQDNVARRIDRSPRRTFGNLYLLRSILRAHLSFLLAPMAARVAVIGFTYAQPFLLFRTTSYIKDHGENKNVGYSLIAATGLVYIGLAVSPEVIQTNRFVAHTVLVTAQSWILQLQNLPSRGNHSSKLGLRHLQ